MTAPLAAGRRPRSLRREDAIAIVNTSIQPPGSSRFAPTIVPQMGTSKREGQLVSVFAAAAVAGVLGRRLLDRRRRLDPPRDRAVAPPQRLDDRHGWPGQP